MNPFEVSPPCRTRLRALADDRRGATSIEYAVIAAGVSVVIIGTVTAVGLAMKTDFFEPVLAALTGS